MKDRFAKLVALTRGAAVLGLSAGGVGATSTIAAGCTRNDPPPVPPMTTGAAQADPPAAPDGGIGLRRFPLPNAVRRWGVGDGGDGSTKPGP